MLELPVLTIVLLCAVVVPAAGFFAARRFRSSDFIHAGRRVSLPAFVATLVCTWYGGILGVGEFTWTYGLVNWLALGFFYYVFAAAYALFLARKVRVATALSIPEQIGRRHGRAAALLASLYTLLMVSPAPYLLMTALILGHVAGLPFLPSLLLALVLTVAYVWRGGLGSVIFTDLIQFLMMFIAFGAALAWLLLEKGGLGFLAAELPPEHLEIPGSLGWSAVVLWGLVALWTLVDPGFHQRVAVARDPRVARRGIAVSIGCWFIFDGLTTTCGLYARALFPDLADPVLAFPALGALFPPLLQGVFIGGMLATVLSTLDSFCFLSGSTVSRDLLNIKGGEREIRAARWGIIGASTAAAAMALWMRSVVDIWLAIASLGIPVLLPVLVHSYLTRPGRSDAESKGGTARFGPGKGLRSVAGFCSMVSGALVSGLWFLWGQTHSAGGYPAYPLSLEPMYPALAVSALVLGGGSFFGRD